MKINSFIAGLIAASLFFAIFAIFSRMGILFILPVFFGSLPVYVSALGWGGQAAISAVLGIATSSAIALGPNEALLISLTVTVPAALAGYQANLARRDQNGRLIWYPIPLILLWMTALIAASTLIFGMAIHFDPLNLGLQIAEQLKPLYSIGGNKAELQMSEISQAITMNLRVAPFIAPSLWLGIHVLNFLLGIKITQLAGVLARPSEDMAASFNLPQLVMIVAALSLAGMIVTSPPISYVFAVVAGSTIMAFSIVGLATMHLRTRGWNGRRPMLAIIYIIIALIFFPVYLFSFGGFIKSAYDNKTPGADSSK